MDFNDALNLFQRTLATERSRPDVHAAMLDLARPDTINEASSQILSALTRGERVWMTSDLHLGHTNVIEYSKRPFFDATQMNEYLVTQIQKVKDDEWLLILGDLTMGDHDQAMEWIRRLPGRKVLVLGNHDLKRNGKCLYARERAPHGRQPLFEAVVPFLFWQDMLGRTVFASHYPATVDHPFRRLVNYHGHLHRDVLPPTEVTHFVNVGWDVTQGLLCL